MDLKTMRNQKPEALRKALQESKARMQELRFQLASGQVRQVREVRQLRRDIARLEHALSEQRSVNASVKSA